MKLGDACVSTSEQGLAPQFNILRQVDCVQAHKPGGEQRLAYARPGDTIVGGQLDRLGPFAKYLIEIVEDLRRRPLPLLSLQDPIDTTLPGAARVCVADILHLGRARAQRTPTLVGSASLRPPGRAPHYQKIASAVTKLHLTRRQPTRQLMAYFQIGSRRTRYNILRFAGCLSKESSTPALSTMTPAVP